jgi:(p)ppGpp synthase/HD superfamily hydrolase
MAGPSRQRHYACPVTDAETAAGSKGTTRDRLTQPDADLVGTALELAGAAHADQVRKDGSPFIGHPRAVGEILEDAGFDDEIVAAALLHDVVEDSEIGAADVERRFGERVAALVSAMTEDSAIGDYGERKRAQRAQVEAAGPDAVAIYAADKLANVRDLRRAYEREGEAIGRRFQVSLDERIAIWREDHEMAARVAPRLPYLRELRYELESLEEQRARRDGG